MIDLDDGSTADNAEYDAQEAAIDQNRRFLDWAHGKYQYELDIQGESLAERAKDADFYDGDQFTDEEKFIYEQRDQVPRVFNEIKPTVDWILGSELRARADWNVLPRAEDDVEIALVKTKLIKYIDDINRAGRQRSKAFADSVKTGEGWTRVHLKKNDEGDLQIYLQYEHWRNMLRDSACRDTIAMTDCKYIWCVKVVEVDSLIARYPEKKKELLQDVGDFQDLQEEQRYEMQGYNTTRNNQDATILRRGSMSIAEQNRQAIRRGVRVWELWYRKSERVKVLRKAGGLNGEIYNEKNPIHQYLVAVEQAQAVETVREQMYCAMYTENTVLYHIKSPYAHNKFPFICRTAFIRDFDGTPYGVIRQIRDPQSDLNARRNRALLLMSSTMAMVEDGAVEDIDQFRLDVAKPNAVIEVKRGYNVKIEPAGQLAAQHVAFAEQDSAYIRQTAGVTGENRGMDSTGKSGIAIQALQEQGTVITTPLIDSHASALQSEGEIVLSLCEQFIDHEMQFRITGDDIKKPEFVTINKKDGEKQTDITASQADFIVAQRDYRQTMRQALSEQMLQVVSNINQTTGDPGMAIALIEMAIDLQDLPNKEQITARLREAAGLPPRDETDEQRDARLQQEQQQSAAQQAVDKARLELEMRMANAEAAEKEAAAMERRAEAVREEANAIKHKVEATKAAMELAGIVQGNPALSPVADDILRNIDEILQKPTESPPQPVTQEPAPDAGFLMPQQQEQSNAEVPELSNE